MDDALLRLSVLGTFRLEKGDTPVNVPGRKARALLAYLALHPEPHAREQLAALFWSSGADADARLSLRVTLSQLKKIHPALVLADTDTVQLNPAAPLWAQRPTFGKSTPAICTAAPIPIGAIFLRHRRTSAKIEQPLIPLTTERGVYFFGSSDALRVCCPSPGQCVPSRRASISARYPARRDFPVTAPLWTRRE